MPIPTPSTANPPLYHANWRALRFLNLYRMTLAGLFTVLAVSGSKLPVLGSSHPKLFISVSLVYLLSSLLFSFAIKQRWLEFPIQLNAHMAVDIFAILLLMHASGGIGSGLGVLLLISIGAGSIMTSRQLAVLYASLASIALLGEQLYINAYLNKADNYTHAGILGVTLFAAALLANSLAKRLVESEALVARQSVDVANLEQLNEYIIQHMQTGILVVDADDRVRLMNESAWQMLDMPAAHQGRGLREVSAALQVRLHQWRLNAEAPSERFRSSTTSPVLQPRFARLGNDADSATLIFLEDMSATAQQAQQLKLASLGRLTASIAHEIRNPLGAISHASQLLYESPGLQHADRRLTQIVLDHSLRMNTIIENVMQLSRRDRAEPVLFDLPNWLAEFRLEYLRNEQLNDSDISLEVSQTDIPVRMDPSQLHQVATNLLDNALRHSTDHTGSPRVELRIGVIGESHAPYLEVADHGTGIPADRRDHVFEPFYTTETRGTGLGLYISRELCEGNQARLDLMPTSEGACFRITFADPRRKQSGTS